MGCFTAKSAPKPGVLSMNGMSYGGMKQRMLNCCWNRGKFLRKSSAIKLVCSSPPDHRCWAGSRPFLYMPRLLIAKLGQEAAAPAFDPRWGSRNRPRIQVVHSRRGLTENCRTPRTQHNNGFRKQRICSEKRKLII